MKDYSKIIGEKYKRLEIVSIYGLNKRKAPIVTCKCECGKTVNVLYYSLRSGNTKSCGCFRSQYVSNKNHRHGLRHSNFYAIWSAMKNRCSNKNDKSYKYYGGSGVHLLWESFYDFYTDMYDSYIEHCNEYGKDNTSIDRVDPQGHYCKNNCRWATWKEQNLFSHKRKFKPNTEVNN